jgi:hypothetical protein
MCPSEKFHIDIGEVRTTRKIRLEIRSYLGVDLNSYVKAVVFTAVFVAVGAQKTGFEA